jgi:hypothetical protein
MNTFIVLAWIVCYFFNLYFLGYDFWRISESLSIGEIAFICIFSLMGPCILIVSMPSAMGFFDGSINRKFPKFESFIEKINNHFSNKCKK